MSLQRKSTQIHLATAPQMILGCRKVLVLIGCVFGCPKIDSDMIRTSVSKTCGQVAHLSFNVSHLSIKKSASDILGICLTDLTFNPSGCST